MSFWETGKVIGVVWESEPQREEQHCRTKYQSEVGMKWKWVFASGHGLESVKKI